MKIGILCNCQHESLAVALRALLPAAEVISFELDHVHRNGALAPVMAMSLLACDHLISQDVAPPYGILSTRQLRAQHKSFHLLPPLRFAGFHPDTIALTIDGATVQGLAGGDQSRIAVAAFLAGLSLDDAEDLLNELVFHRLGYFRFFDVQLQLLLEQYAIYGIDLAPAVASWKTQGCFMHSAVHPKIGAILDLARIICARLGLSPAAVDAESLPDPLLPFSAPPVFAALAAAHGMAEGVAARAPGGLDQTMSNAAFIRQSYETFARVPLARLRAGNGVIEAMAQLGLREMARPKPPAPGAGSALISVVGEILRVEQATGVLMQCKLTPPSEDESDFHLNLPSRRLTAPIRLPVLDGIECSPAELPGVIHIRRAQAYLSVAPGRALVNFAAATPTAWEMFLPVAPETVAALRVLLAHNWREVGHGIAVPRDSIAIGRHFQLSIGERRFSLLTGWVAAAADADGVIVVTLTQATVTLRLGLDSAADALDELLLSPAPVPPEAGSVEEFRAAAGHSLVFAVGAELIHAPMVVCDVDRDWVMAALDRKDAPPLGRVTQDVTLARARNAVVLLSPGHEGTVLSAAGVHKGLAALATAADAPEGLRRDGPHTMISRDFLAAGPLVEGPVCVPYGSAPERYSHWLSTGLVNLHVMAAALPPQTRLLLPASLNAARQAADGFDYHATLLALGLTQFKLLDLDAASCRVQDVTWMEEPGSAGLPASALRGFRERARRARPEAGRGGRKIYLRQRGARQVGNVQQVEGFFRHHGFDCLALEEMSPVEQIDVFLQASFVVAPHGAALANLLFCGAGTRVLEFSPEVAFRPDYWLIAEKLGLNYAVLPCPTQNGGFNGTLIVDQQRMRALYRMLTLRD